MGGRIGRLDTESRAFNAISFFFCLWRRKEDKAWWKMEPGHVRHDCVTIHVETKG